MDHPVDLPRIFEGGAIRTRLGRAGAFSEWLDSPGRRALLVWAATWLPLCLLALASGLATGGVRVPFFADYQAHARFLVALPLLVAAQSVADRNLTPVLATFVERGVVRDGDRARFDALLAAAGRWVGSWTAEVALVLFVVAAGRAVLRSTSMVGVATWYGAPTGAGLELTAPGLWYVWVALPLFQLFQARWIFRSAVWAILLFRVSRLDLHLVPTHPDRAGGLGFLGTKLHALSTLLVAEGSVVAGVLASRIFHDGGRLDAYEAEIGAYVLLALVVVLGPPSVFAPLLLRTKRVGKSRYGRLANRYVRAFDRKWIDGEAPAEEPLLGSGDIQSLADLGNSYGIVNEMRAVPYGRDRIVGTVAALLLPVAPLLLTLFPARELLQKLIRTVL